MFVTCPYLVLKPRLKQVIDSLAPSIDIHMAAWSGQDPGRTPAESRVRTIIRAPTDIYRCSLPENKFEACFAKRITRAAMACGLRWTCQAAVVNA
jgi:hypothetical protein